MSYQQPHYPPQPYGYAAQPPEQQDSVGSWVLTLFICSLPLIGLIYLIVLAAGSGESPAKRNFARASLIWMAIGLVIGILVLVIVAVTGGLAFMSISSSWSS